MSTPAKVGSIDHLRQFRAALVKFAESADAAIGDAESEIQRIINWVENDQASYWAGQHRKRQEAVVKAKEALRHKQLFKDVTGGRQATIEEEKAVALALRRVAESEQKMAAIKRWSRQLEKEFQLYKGAVQRLQTTITAGVPVALGKLDRMTIALDQYVALGAPTEVTSSAEPAGGGASMSRPEAGPPRPGDVYRRLREKSPNAAARDAAPAGDPTRANWPLMIPPGNLQTLEAVPLAREILDPSAIVIYATDVWTQSRVYLHRVEPAFPGDSGWYIGSIDATETPTLEAARVNQVLTAWPSIADFLVLPAGTLVVIDSAGVAALLSREDNDLWPR
ncbi:MAG TPA: hypothetical protein VH370_08715 [Humisphaera sp.]|jgi:hypothetical protein|nr:hypothetical protein [Humisphaera sp.]